MGRAEDIFERIIKGGENEIDEFIITRESEELFLDFKRSADDGDGQRLHQKDRENLAKAISGFGNSEGGVIVWGVDCSKTENSADVAHAKYPIHNVKRFKSWLEGAVSGCTMPPHGGVQHHCITNDKGNGFVITYIPKSIHAPHQALVGKQYFYIRAGSSFCPAPYSVLAGMFGRRPQPRVFHVFTILPAKLINDRIEIEVGFLIRNQGPVIASDLYMNALVISLPGDNCESFFDVPDQTNWITHYTFGSHISLVSKADFRLAPEYQVQTFLMTLLLAPPFSKKLIIDCICGCGQCAPFKFKIENDSDSINRLYNDFLLKKKRGLLNSQDEYRLVKDLLNIERPEKQL